MIEVLTMHNLYTLSEFKSRSISAENFTGEKGKAAMATEGTGANAARELGQGWKVSPSIRIAAGETFMLNKLFGTRYVVAPNFKVGYSSFKHASKYNGV